MPSGQLSNVPWRRSGVKYANNEAYFDVVEEVDAIIDKSGATVSAEIQGYVCNIYSLSSVSCFIKIINSQSCTTFIQVLIIMQVIISTISVYTIYF